MGGATELNFFGFVGSQGDDTIVADSNAQSTDVSDGNDEVDYSNSTAGVTVDLASGFGSSGDAAGDTYANVENVTGSDFDDKIVGDAADNSVFAGDGADSIEGAGGSDSIAGGTATTTFTAIRRMVPHMVR